MLHLVPASSREKNMKTGVSDLRASIQRENNLKSSQIDLLPVPRSLQNFCIDYPSSELLADVTGEASSGTGAAPAASSKGKLNPKDFIFSGKQKEV